MEFNTYLQHKGMVTTTITRHQREVEKYSSFLEGKRTIAESATKKDLLGYLKYLKEERNLSNVTQNQLLGMLKNYYSYLSTYYEVQDITKLIKIRGIKRKELRPVFTVAQFDQLCEAYRDYDRLQQSNYIALTLVGYQGLQPLEIIALCRDSFDLRKASVCVRGSRRGAARTLKLEALQMVSLVEYFNGSATTIITNHNQLERIGKDLKTLTKGSQILFLDFRQLRASRITHWIETEGLRKAQYLAGHKNIANTEQYKSNNFKTLQEHLDNYHPLQ